MNIKNFILIAVISFTVSLAGLVATQPAQATYPWQVCGQGLHVGNPHCVPSIIDEVTPTGDISPAPTLEITPDVTEAPTASPTAEVKQTVEDKHVDVSDGLSSCPDCTKAHNGTNVPAGAPKTGRGL